MKQYNHKLQVWTIGYKGKLKMIYWSYFCLDIFLQKWIIAEILFFETGCNSLTIFILKHRGTNKRDLLNCKRITYKRTYKWTKFWEEMLFFKIFQNNNYNKRWMPSCCIIFMPYVFLLWKKSFIKIHLTKW